MQSDIGRNYFELFGLPAAFELDTALLSERYLELQRTIHPDKFANATDRERRMSVQQAAIINEAFNTLKSPLGRARYLLGLHGLEVNDESNTVMDAAFLMQQMALRESLEEIGESKNIDALEAFVDDVRREKKALVGKLTDLFLNADEAGLKQAHEVTLKMQFLDKLLAEAEELEEGIL